ncbi:MAG: hypothetical protein H7X76_05570 [Prolixibacteraceae bacterium]|nr:hypothetical protein [Burkholderiales bacterium]
MTSRLHFELFMQQLRVRASKSGPKQLAFEAMRQAASEDVGSVRLSRIEAAMKETRADRADE